MTQAGAERPAGFVQRIFGQDATAGKSSAKPKGRSDVAQVPSTVLTVEYVDGSEGMEAAVRALDERLGRLEKLLRSMQESNVELVSAINLQAKEMTRFLESMNRRVDRVYGVVSGGAPAQGGAAAPPAGAEAAGFDVPAEFAEDQAHQQAWRVARVMAGDLDAYYPDQVREGVVYGNLFELLADPIQQARETFNERVPAKVSQKVDYLDLALKELIANKRRQLAEEEQPGARG